MSPSNAELIAEATKAGVRMDERAAGAIEAQSAEEREQMELEAAELGLGDESPEQREAAKQKLEKLEDVPAEHVAGNEVYAGLDLEPLDRTTDLRRAHRWAIVDKELLEGENPCSEIARNFAARCKHLWECTVGDYENAAGDLSITEIARAQRIGNAAGSAEREVSRAFNALEQQAIDRAAILQQEMRFSAKGGAIEAEVRAYFRELSKADRILFMRDLGKSRDHASASAILGAPHYLSGTEADELHKLGEIAKAAFWPEKMAEFRASGKAIQEAKRLSRDFAHLMRELIPADLRVASTDSYELIPLMKDLSGKEIARRQRAKQMEKALAVWPN